MFNTQAIDSILNQTVTSGVKQYFGITSEVSKGGSEPDMMKLLDTIENAEKKENINLNNNNKNKITVSKLKKGQFNDIIQYQKATLLNEEYCKKMQSAFNRKKSGERENSGNDHNELDLKLKKKNIKELLRQNTENNNNFYKKRNIFSTQITYNNHMKNIFDLKSIDSIKKIKKNSKKIKENNTERNLGKQLYKNNSQTYGSLINVSSKYSEKNYKIDNKDNKDKENLNQCNLYNKNISEELSINKSDTNNIKNDRTINTKKNFHKDNISRNNEIFKIENNIKTCIEDNIKNSSQGKNTITSYKNKSRNKHRTNGYQTSRNKYDNKNMYLNVSKSNISKNHQSIDNELNNHRIIKKAINQLKNNHNTFKNNLINALLGCGNNKKKKISKDIFIKKDNNSIIDSIDLKNCIYKDKTNNCKANAISNEKLNLDNNNENDKNNNDKNDDDQQKLLIDNNNNQNKKIINTSNIENNNNKNSYSSCDKVTSIGSYANKYKNSCSSTNNKKQQISSSKIPTCIIDNKVLNNTNISKKSNRIIEDFDNKNKIKEFIDNCLDDYFYSKIKNNINNSQIKNINQKENNNNNFCGESKSKSKNKNEVLSSGRNNQEKKNEKADSTKIRNSIFNFEKRIAKKFSEKNLNIIEKIKIKNSPNNNSNKKTFYTRVNKTGNMQSKEYGPLSARESNSKYQLNAEIVELLSNKIQKIKQSMKKFQIQFLQSSKKRKFLQQAGKLSVLLQKKLKILLIEKRKIRLKQEIKNHAKGSEAHRQSIKIKV